MIRRPIHRLLLFVFAGFTIAGCSPDYLLPRTEGMQEVNFRQGLPNFFSKVKSGKGVTIAYFGGSITEANNGWRDITYKWMDSAYASASFTQVNATIGGTGSDLGVFRMDRDVLNFHPDLLFIEFASNDTGTPEAIYRSMEGIVRKTWKKYPNTDICFIYTVIESSVKSLESGTYQPTALAMEKIAEHYGIPSIHMGVPVARLLDSGKLVFTGLPSEHPGKLVFTSDGTHPQSAAAHNIYAQAVERGFKWMENFAGEMPHILPAAYTADNWESAQMISLSETTIKNDWELLPSSDPLSKQSAKYLPELYKASVPGASFTVKFNGKVLGIYDFIGPSSGIVDVIIDGKPAIEIFRFDAWCDYYRPHNFFLKELPEGDHEVRFQVTGKQFDKAAILARRNISITNPDLYKENSWYVGSVMLLGKLNP